MVNGELRIDGFWYDVAPSFIVENGEGVGLP